MEQTTSGSSSDPLDPYDTTTRQTRSKTSSLFDLFNPTADETLRRFNAGLSEHWTRYFVVELAGTFALTLLRNLFAYTWLVHYSVAYASSNCVAGLAYGPPSPNIGMTCTMAGQCKGKVSDPLAGSTVPIHSMDFSLLSGVAYALCSMAAPGATMNLSITLAACVGGLREWRLLLPSLAGQFCGAFLSLILLYWITDEPMDRLRDFTHMPREDMIDLAFTMFGLRYPSERISNGFAFLATMVQSICMVILILSMAIRNQSIPPIAQDLGKGLVIAVFGASFGANGIGCVDSPMEWFACACMFQLLAWHHAPEVHIWSRHEWYALKVPLFACPVGVVLGSSLVALYMYTLIERRKPADEDK